MYYKDLLNLLCMLFIFNWDCIFKLYNFNLQDILKKSNCLDKKDYFYSNKNIYFHI